MLKAKYGFTIVELLVVISVISTIASIILASLGNSMTKAKIAGIIEETNQIRNQIEQSWNGNFYAAFIKHAALGSYNAWYVAPNSFTDNNIITLINEITARNGGLYAGWHEGLPLYSVDFSCDFFDPQGNYPPSDNNPSFYASNGITIYVYPPCAPVTNYAIYSSFVPIQLYDSGSLTDPKRYSGYYCVDSTGGSVTKTDGWIPGYTGVAPTYTTNPVVDGKCH